MVKKESKITRHFKVSVVKSVMRIVGFIALLSSISIAVVALITAELVSIVEELV